MVAQDTIQISFGDPIRTYQLADVLPQRFGPGGYPASMTYIPETHGSVDTICARQHVLS